MEKFWICPKCNKWNIYATIIETMKTTFTGEKCTKCGYKLDNHTY